MIYGLFEMLEPLRSQIPHAVLFGNTNGAGLVSYFPNLRDSYTVHFLWKSGHVIRPHRKEQFKIFAAV